MFQIVFKTLPLEWKISFPSTSQNQKIVSHTVHVSFHNCWDCWTQNQKVFLLLIEILDLVMVIQIINVQIFGLAHTTGVHERITVPMHETQFRGKARIVCQTQGKARFRHISGTGLTHFRSIFGTVNARFRHVLGTVSTQLWHAVYAHFTHG